MQAIVYREYGGPEVLRLEDIAKPAPKDNEVLVKIHAASVNPLDWHYLRAEPRLMRLMLGLRKPKHTRLGADVAGHVEAVGRSVTRFKPGDAVFGAARGAFGEYVCALERALALKPDQVTFEQAASVPVAGLSALQGLRDRGRLQSGQAVLINGASGGVGTFAVQLAKTFGAAVTGVCSTGNVQLVRALGADHVIDYTRGDFTQDGRRYDVLLDCIGNHSLGACRRVLKPKGVYIALGGTAGRWISPMQRVFQAWVMSMFVSQKMSPFMARLRQEDLTVLGELLHTGKITPVIDRRYPLHEVAEAIRYLETGHARGKVIIAVSDHD